MPNMMGWPGGSLKVPGENSETSMSGTPSGLETPNFMPWPMPEPGLGENNYPGDGCGLKGEEVLL